MTVLFKWANYIDRRLEFDEQGTCSYDTHTAHQCDVNSLLYMFNYRYIESFWNMVFFVSKFMQYAHLFMVQNY